MAHRVGAATGCQTISAGIDTASRYHVAAGCNGSIRYFVSTDGRSWSTTLFAHPAHRTESEPQIAFQGSLVYVAYTRFAPDDGCGSDGAEVGVYYRSRQQPDGAWSSPTRLGAVADRLQAFRVDGDVLHATVRNERDGLRYYESLEGSTYHRYRIPWAVGGTALRVGSDGHARILYETAGGLWYAIFTGSGFSTSRIPGTKEDDWDPQLVLDSSDTPHLLWNRSPPPGFGCVVRGPNPDDGIYYATTDGGPWAIHRITRDPYQASLQFDESRGRPDVMQQGRFGLYFFTTTSSGRWTRTRVLRKQWPQSPLLRRDPASGTLLAVFADEGDNGRSTIYALTTR